MQRVLSSTYGAGRADVGQACRQISQLPQVAFKGVSLGFVVPSVKGRLVTISARKTQDPQPFVKIVVFLPYQPNPALCATARSTIRPVSTDSRVSIVSTSWRACARSRVGT